MPFSLEHYLKLLRMQLDQLEFLKSSDNTTQAQLHDALIKMTRDAVSTLESQRRAAG